MAELMTPDNRYIVVRGRLWRAANPLLGADQREQLTRALMDARRAVAAALRRDDGAGLATARAAVNRAKIALGERGPVWWDDGAPDLNRRLVKNTPYASWFARRHAAAAADPGGQDASPGLNDGPLG